MYIPNYLLEYLVTAAVSHDLNFFSILHFSCCDTIHSSSHGLSCKKMAANLLFEDLSKMFLFSFVN